MPAHSQPTVMPNGAEAKKEGMPLDKSHDETVSTLPPQPIQDQRDIQVVQTPQPDRAELVNRARTFLASQQVAHQDVSVKRKFLAEKGMHDTEIDALLREIPLSSPLVPPRSYPQPRPSNLPNLLLGIFRICSWATGGFAALLFIYWRYILPRIARTLFARQSYRSHYSSLLQKFTTSLSAFKESQAESYSALPRADPYREPKQYSTCRTVDDVLEISEKGPNHPTKIPAVTLMRVAIADIGPRGQELVSPTTEDLFQYLEGKISWLTSDSGRKYEQMLWETLNACPSFARSSEASPDTGADENSIITRWSYHSPDSPEPSRLQSSFGQLSFSLPKTGTQDNKYNHTMQALSDLTGYISAQIYLPYRTLSNIGGLPSAGSSSPAEEELRREIRALKGLVLNRRSFMASLPRANSSSSIQRPNVQP